MTRVVPFKRVVRINPDLLPETTRPDFEFRYIDITSVGRGVLTREPALVSFGEAPTRARRRVDAGDTILSTVRTYLGAVLPIGPSESDHVASTGFAVLRPKRDVDPGFLGWLVQSSWFLGEVESRSVGVSYPAIAPSSLGEIKVRIPSAETQPWIAGFLDRETARIDDLIAKKQRLIDLLEERRVSLITSAVTKGLDPGVPMRDSGLPWIGDVPSHWSIAPLRRCADVRLSSIDKKTEEGETTVQLCNYTDVYYGSYLGPSEAFMTATASQSQIDRLALKEGDVLITKDSETPDDIGVPAVVGEPMPGVVCGYHLALLRPTGHLTGRYLYWALASHDINSHLRLTARGVTRFGLTLQAIGDTPIPVPPPDEQHHIERRLRETDTQVGGLRRRVEEQIDLLAEYRQALITAAVTGELDITTHDGDEALDEVTESA